VELWERSLVRSRLRREREAARRANAPTARKVGFALAAATVIAPLGQSVANAQSTATTSSHNGMLHKGDRGPAVVALQRQLGISADGVVGPLTRAALGGGTSTGGGGATRGPKPSRSVTIAVQSKLGIPADGVYGPQSRAAVRAFQARNGLEVDGVVGPQTLAALGLSNQSAGSPSGGGGSALGAVRSVIGTRYVLGGTGPGGFDCSGLMVWAFKQAGVSLPRTSFQQWEVGVPVSRANVQAGDLVFFNANGPGASHVGIATSNSTAISATTHGVREHALGGSYWGAHYLGARRL
jgi:cell wall-associated NlpC family hydrolase